MEMNDNRPAEAFRQEAVPETPEDAPAKAQAAWQYLTQLDVSDVPAALRDLVGSGRMIAFLNSLSLPELTELASLIADNPHQLDGRRLSSLLSHLDNRSPKLAFNIRLKLNRASDPSFKPSLQGAFISLAEADPHLAFSQWRLLKEDSLWADRIGAKSLSSIFNQWQRKDLEGALTAFAALPDGEEKEHARYGLAHAVATMFSGPPETWRPEAAALSKQLLAGANETLPYGWIIGRTAAARLEVESSEAMLAWYRSLELSPEQHRWAAWSVAEGWASKILQGDAADASTAWDWLVVSVPENERALALAFAVRKWSRADQNIADPFSQQGPLPDLAACSEWLISQGLGPESQEAMAVLAKAWGQQYEPEAALAWARVIPDETQRRQAEAAVTEELNKRFPAGWEAASEPLEEPPR